MASHTHTIECGEREIEITCTLCDVCGHRFSQAELHHGEGIEWPDGDLTCNFCAWKNKWISDREYAERYNMSSNDDISIEIVKGKPMVIVHSFRSKPTKKNPNHPDHPDFPNRQVIPKTKRYAGSPPPIQKIIRLVALTPFYCQAGIYYTRTKGTRGARAYLSPL